MSLEAQTITLGGRSFAVRPLTLRQLRVILPAFARASIISDAGSVDDAAAIIAAAVSRDAPDMTVDAVLDLEATVPELAAAVTVVAKLSGLVSSGEAKPPEAGAAPSTGDGSTAA